MPMVRVIAEYIHGADEQDSQMIFDVRLNENGKIDSAFEFYGCSLTDGIRYPFILQADDEDNEIEIYWGIYNPPFITTMTFQNNNNNNIVVGAVFIRTDQEGGQVTHYDYQIAAILAM